MVFNIENNILKTDELSICFVGHVDAGKSTTAGQVLAQSKTINERELAKLKKEAEEKGKGTFYLAFSFDTTADEQKRGITINTSAKQFRSPNKGIRITINDAPGHRDFIGNMARGTVQCQVGVLIVSMIPSEFLAGISPLGQTLQHIIIGNALGIKRWIVAYNKMDAQTVNFQEKLFNETRDEMNRIMKKCGVKPTLVQHVPVSGYNNINVGKRDSEDQKKMPWYTGPSLIELIEDVGVIEYDLSTPARMAVTGVRKVGGIGEVVTGKVITGKFTPDMKVDIAPVTGTATIKSMEMFKSPVKEAYPGMDVGFTLKASTLKEKLEPGAVLGAANTGLTTVKCFEAEIIFLGHVKQQIHVGFKPHFNVHTARMSCNLVKFERIIDKNKQDCTNVRDYATGMDRCRVMFQPEKPVCFEADKKFGTMNRLVVRNSKDTIGVGAVRSICNDKYNANFVPPKKVQKMEQKKNKTRTKGA